MCHSANVCLKAFLHVCLPDSLVLFDVGPVLVNPVHRDLGVRSRNGHEFVDQLWVTVHEEPSNEATETVPDQDELVRIKDLDYTPEVVQNSWQGVFAQIVGLI